MLNESIQYHSSLNSKVWNGFKLKPEIAKQLLKIAHVFCEDLDVPNLQLSDIVLTGSLANYNFTEQSDYDLHLVVDFDELNITPEDFIQKYFNAKKNDFNLKHDITIYGYPVELYVEDVKQPAKATGRYSLMFEKWIAIPTGLKDEEFDLTSDPKYLKFANEIDMLGDDDLQQASNIMNAIYDMRASGLEKNGELSDDNLIFKELRNHGYLDKLRQYMYDALDKELSL